MVDNKYGYLGSEQPSFVYYCMCVVRFVVGCRLTEESRLRFYTAWVFNAVWQW